MLDAWKSTNDKLPLSERDGVLRTALDSAVSALSEDDRAVITSIKRRIAKQTRNIGESSALELLAVVGLFLADHPELLEESDE